MEIHQGTMGSLLILSSMSWKFSFKVDNCTIREFIRIACQNIVF